MANSTNRLSISLDELKQAGTASGVAPEQSEQIWQQLTQNVAVSRSGAAQIAWYFGAAVMLVAMTWLMAQVAMSYGNGPTLILSLVYTGAFAFAGSRLVNQPALRVPGGLLYALAAAMTPVSVYSVEKLLSAGGDTDAGFLVMMLATVGVGAFFTLRSRISFVSVPSLIAGGAATMTIADLLARGNFHFSYWNEAVITYGALVTVFSFLCDRPSGEDYAFWGYLVGAVALLTGLTALDKGEFGYVLYAVGGLVSVFAAMILSRRVFAFTGGAAVLIFCGHLMYEVFENSTAFPLALTALGAASIYLGIWYRRNSQRVEKAALALVPRGLRRLLPGER